MESIGQALKKAREDRKMTVPEVAYAIKAKIEYIQAIEADDFRIFPAPIYAKGFIRLYAECVGLNPQSLTQTYRNREAEEMPEPPPAKEVRMLEPVVKPSRSLLRGFAAPWKAALKRVRWPESEVWCALPFAVRLPMKTWKTILAVAGMILLVIVAVVVLWWYVSWKNGAETSPASRWIAEPPAPYLNTE